MDPAHNLDGAREKADDAAEVNVDSDVFELVNRRAADDEFTPGMLVSDNIRLGAMLGAGGMGNVWIAEHMGLDTPVAVKFMSKDLAEDPGCVARFGAEAKLAARIKSPHVVSILDFATTVAKIPYIVMELLDGEDLEVRLRGGKKVGLEDSSRILVQICKALASAHELGVVHRDIKPDNVFLAKHDGEIFVKVLDFGIAKDEAKLKSITASGTTMGTPAFMSPEQLFRPKEVDLRSDLWSAAVVAYRCLTGKLPFEGDNFGTMCISVNNGTFAPPSSVDPSLPRGLDVWFQKALSVDPNARFQSASDMTNSFLAELDKAGLLPHWAALRDAKSYSSDPGGILGGPIIVQKTRRFRGRALLLAVLAMTTCLIAATPREKVVAFAGWTLVPVHDMPHLLPSPDEPPLAFDQPPRAWVPLSRPASATRDVARPAFVPRTESRNPYDGPAPAGSTDKPAPHTPPSVSAQFGI